MKKILLILLISAYAVSTMGVGFGEFYCGGKLKSTFLALGSSDKANCAKEGCCKTRYQFFKLKDNHVAGTDIYFPAKHFIAINFPAPAFITVSFAQQNRQAHRSHAPPLYDDDVPLYLSNSVFRI